MRTARKLRVQSQYRSCGASWLSCEVYQTRGKQSLKMVCPTIRYMILQLCRPLNNAYNLTVCQNVRQQLGSSICGTPRNTIEHMARLRLIVLKHRRFLKSVTTASIKVSGAHSSSQWLPTIFRQGRIVSCILWASYGRLLLAILVGTYSSDLSFQALSRKTSAL